VCAALSDTSTAVAALHKSSGVVMGCSECQTGTCIVTWGRPARSNTTRFTCQGALRAFRKDDGRLAGDFLILVESFYTLSTGISISSAAVKFLQRRR